MALMAVCALMLVLGLLAVGLWGGGEVSPALDDPDVGVEGDPSMSLVAKRYARGVVIAVVSGVGAGLLVAGAGGRLAMRLLAVTAGNAAQGRTTEADEIVGQITLDGTFGFIVFTGLFFGSATGAAYMLIRRWLPDGRLGGLAYGALLLVLAGTRLEPLRADNPDFDIVGPSWLAALIFATLVIVHGMLVAALAARYSRVIPLLSKHRRALLAHAPLIALAPMFPVFFALTIVGLLSVGLSRVRPLVEALRSRRAALAGYVVIIAASLVALPSAALAIVDIASRS